MLPVMCACEGVPDNFRHVIAHVYFHAFYSLNKSEPKFAKDCILNLHFVVNMPIKDMFTFKIDLHSSSYLNTVKKTTSDYSNIQSKCYITRSPSTIFYANSPLSVGLSLIEDAHLRFSKITNFNEF